MRDILCHEHPPTSFRSALFAVASGIKPVPAAAPNTRSLAADFAGGIALYGIPIVTRLLAGTLVVPIYTRYLTPADYGVLELLDLTSILFGTLIGIYFVQAVFYYYSAASDDAGRARSIGTAFYGSLLIAGLGLLLGWAGAKPVSRLIFGNTQQARLLLVALATIALSAVSEVGLCCLRTLDRRRTYAVVGVGRTLFGVACNLILLVGLHMGLAALVWGSMAVTIATALCVTWVLLPWLRSPFDGGLFVKYVKYSWPLNLSAVAMLTLDLGDRYVLKHSVSLAQIGIYGLAYKFGMIVNAFSLVFNQFWRPRMFSLVKEPNGEALYARVYTYYLFTILYVVLGTIVVVCPVLRLVVGPGFEDAAVYVPWIALAYLLRLSGDFFRNAFYLNKRTGYEAKITWLGTVVCVIGYLTLIPPFKLWGAIWATGVAFGVMLVASLWTAQRVQYFHFEWRRVLLVAGCGLSLALLYLFVEPATARAQLILGILFTACYPCILIVPGFLRDDEKRFLRAQLVRLHGSRQRLRKAPLS